MGPTTQVDESTQMANEESLGPLCRSQMAKQVHCTLGRPFGGKNCFLFATCALLLLEDLVTDTDFLYKDSLYTDSLYTDFLYTDFLYTVFLYTDFLFTDFLYTDYITVDYITRFPVT